MSGELRGIPEIRPAEGTQRPASQISVQGAIQTLAENIHKLEGRLGEIALRDSVVVDGDVTVEGDVEGESLTLSNSFIMAERAVNVGGGTAPDISGEGEGVIYFDRSVDAFLVSQNGGAFAELVPPFDSARVYHNVAQLIPTGVNTVLSFNSERDDPTALHSGSNPSRLTAVRAGFHLMGASVEFAANATGSRYLILRVNGTTIIGITSTPALASGPTYLSIPGGYYLNAGDYVEVLAQQTSGGDLNVNSNANFSPEFWIQRHPRTPA